MVSNHMARTEERDRGRESAIERLYRDHADRTYRLAYLLTGDRHLASDLTQESFVRVLGRYYHLRNRSSLDAYLKRTLINLVTAHFRRRSTERKHVMPTPREIADHAPGIETNLDLWVSLNTIPRRQRTAIVLRFYEDMSEHQVADMLGTSVKAVNSLITRGLANLRQEEGRGP